MLLGFERLHLGNSATPFSECEKLGLRRNLWFIKMNLDMQSMHRTTPLIQESRSLD